MDPPPASARDETWFFCTTCGTALRLGAWPAGERTWCHSCGAHTRVPEALRQAGLTFEAQPRLVAQPAALPRIRWLFRAPAGVGCVLVALALLLDGAQDENMRELMYIDSHSLGAAGYLLVPFALVALVLFPAAFPLRSSRLDWVELGGLSLLALAHVVLIYFWLTPAPA